ncbi:MAG: dTDP-4-dehydrorhamnose reductase [Pusillimonas sp.]|nr:dTDP-4-dehydrorhamnose reductase [Pusillimonas sp.]
MKILLFGKNGQVGWELQRSLAPLGTVIAPAHTETDPTFCGDLTNLERLAYTVNELQPDIIVNAAAYTAVDKAESEPEQAHLINARAPEVLAEAAAKCGAWLVHYSTDYVFNGSGNKPWQEHDATDPLNVYGQTKRDGEQAIIASQCKHLIFRTSWVYASRGGNFIRTMLKLGQTKEHLRIINDQIGAPTGADLIADTTALALRQAFKAPHTQGIYHLTAEGETSWYEYARFIFNQTRQNGILLKISDENINAVDSTAFPTPAMRPKNSRLNTKKLQSTFALTLPNWRNGVRRALIETLEK